MAGLHMKSRRDRLPVALEAEVTAGDQVSRVKVIDLTGDGCCVTGTYRIGEWLKVAFPGASEVRAQVRWTIFGKAGLRFEQGLGR